MFPESRVGQVRRILPLLLALPCFPAGADALLEEVLVTAQKREQNLQDVPVAVSAYTAA